jgi:hypothetical protein
MKAGLTYRVIGPDGIPDRPEPYQTRQEAEDAKTAFVERFRRQGYYLTASGERIPLVDLPRFVKIEEYTKATDATE